MADSASGNIDLPTFEKGKTYLLTGETLQAIVDVIKENRLVLTGNFQFDEVGPDGSKLPLSTVELQVCIDGQTQTRKFVIVPG